MADDDSDESKTKKPRRRRRPSRPRQKAVPKTNQGAPPRKPARPRKPATKASTPKSRSAVSKPQGLFGEGGLVGAKTRQAKEKAALLKAENDLQKEEIRKRKLEKQWRDEDT